MLRFSVKRLLQIKRDMQLHGIIMLISLYLSLLGRMN